MTSQPPYADLECHVPEAWEDMAQPVYPAPHTTAATFRWIHRSLVRTNATLDRTIAVLTPKPSRWRRRLARWLGRGRL